MLPSPSDFYSPDVWVSLKDIFTTEACCCQALRRLTAWKTAARLSCAITLALLLGGTFAHMQALTIAGGVSAAVMAGLLIVIILLEKNMSTRQAGLETRYNTWLEQADRTLLSQALKGTAKELASLQDAPDAQRRAADIRVLTLRQMCLNRAAASDAMPYVPATSRLKK
ncbi:MAG: hypothetical protein IJ189_13955 [Clostridia bacterium]|nr:hypothetical protein [Clostridia bacterium]